MNWKKTTSIPVDLTDQGYYLESKPFLGYFYNGKEWWLESVRFCIWKEDNSPCWVYHYDGEMIDKHLTHYCEVKELPKL